MQAERHRRNRASVTLLVTSTEPRTLAHPQVLLCSFQSILLHSVIPACRVTAALWGRPLARLLLTLTCLTKNLLAVMGYSFSLLRILTPLETSIQQSRLVWRR